MKRFTSLLLTVVMVMSMIIVPTTAVEGNAGVFYHGANVDVASLGTSWFNYSYMYISGKNDDSVDYVKRVHKSGAEHYGGYDYTQVFDFKVTDYGEGADHFTDFTFSNKIERYHYGYSFTHKAFVVYDMYMPGFDPNGGHFMLAKMSYDLQLDTWYEMAIRFVDKTITIYLNGVEMLVADLTYLYNEVKGEDPEKGFIGTWDWETREKPENMESDMLFFTAVDVDMYLDNMAFYSGDFDIATGTATTTYCEDSDFADMVSEVPAAGEGESRRICDYYYNENFVYDPNGGTEKVTYDRAEASTHTHEWVHNEELSSVAHCTVAGYDLYECANGCGASEQRNYVAPLGHVPGNPISTITAADAENTGVEKRMCLRRHSVTNEVCNTIYTTIMNLTDSTNGALHGYTDGGTSFYNGTMGVNQPTLFAIEGGVMVEFDIMPLNHIKDFAEIGAKLGGNDHDYWVGYKYDVNKFVIEHNGVVVAESDKAFNDFEWQKWAIVHDELEILFYVDGEVLLSADVPEDFLTLTKVDDEGEISTKTLEDIYQFSFATPSCEILLDNIVVASPDFDFKTRAGVIYSYLNFNEGEYTDDGSGNFIYNTEASAQTLYATSFNKGSGAGYKVEAHGRPVEAYTEIHEDRALKIDCDYDIESKNAYSMLWAPDEGQEGVNLNDVFAEYPDLEFTYDFYAYDWCTDETIMNYTEEVTSKDDAGNDVVTVVDRQRSAYLGSHVNGKCENADDGSDDSGNVFAGYDFIKQQAVIGSISSQAGGYYGSNTIGVDYAVEKNTWHNMSIRYKLEKTHPDYEEGAYIISVCMDGKEIITKTYSYYDFDVEYFIFYPNFVKGYLDNITLKLNGVTYTDALDFTNGYIEKTAGMDFHGDNGAGSSAYSIVPGGVPTHVYEETIYPAGCLEDGWTDYVCSCGDSAYTLYNLPATGHEYDEGVVTVEPSGTSVGEMTYTCVLCGDTYTEEIAKLFTYGDLNNSGGEPDNTDLSLLRRFLKGANVTISMDAADVNGSGGEPNNTDLSVLRRFLKGANVTLGPAA